MPILLNRTRQDFMRLNGLNVVLNILGKMRKHRLSYCLVLLPNNCLHDELMMHAIE